MKIVYLVWLGLMTGPLVSHAQRPTAEAARPVSGFWPLDAARGTVVFAAPVARPGASARQQTEYARAWLTRTCATWTEGQTGVDSVFRYQGLLRGVHPTVGLRFVLELRRSAAGWHYRLFDCLVRSPTGTDLVHWLPLHRLLDDPDFRPDVRGFQQQLQQALPTL